MGTPKLMPLIHDIERLPRGAVILLGILLIVLVFMLDFLTGWEISLSVFYLIPVAFLTWMGGRAEGFAGAFLCAVSWYLADKMAGHEYTNHLIPIWNAVVRLGFFIIVSTILASLNHAYDMARKFASTDPLTGAINVRHFSTLAKMEIERARRYGHSFTVAYLDIDNFKNVNDRFGHDTGNDLLITLSDLIKQNVRANDVLARMGGDEFIIMLPETGAESSRRVLDKIQLLLGDMMKRNSWPATLSMGAVTFDKPPESVDSMIKQADNLMYEVKSAGKNKILYKVVGQA